MFNLSSVINMAIAILTRIAGEKNLKLTTNITGDLAPSYKGDSSRIRQILINLLNNAIKFTESGTISVACSLSGKKEGIHRVLISITDTGIGMDETFMERAFEKFTQEESTSSRKYGGTGLGLAITRELVQLMNGTINVNSKRGIGTTVEIELDLETASEIVVEAETADLSFQALRNRKILLVEDTDSNRLVAMNSLTFFGMSVTEAVNGAEAIDILKRKSFDLVLMDLQMPLMDGLEATRVIREEMKSNIPIIALTANAFKAEMDRCLAAGMNDYITKPFDENVLLEAILRLLHMEVQPIPEVKRQTEAVEGGSLYNLDDIRQFSRGNPDFVKNMIRLFIRDIPAAVEIIRQAWYSNEMETVWKTAHKIRPTLGQYGLVKLMKDAQFIEEKLKEGVLAPEIEEMILKLHEMVGRVAKELEKEL